ncbi:MAG: oxygen-independent coproporphyrinogen III oxidase [Planktotalea sp.]|uniref:oxygen-independent coproporphyrinogen III oxidase n=1 Tax=Planktotalea sp. TaxID=2029877 RepID=UPI003C73DF29
MTMRNQLERLGLFDAKVPRYTSYPTSPHFSEQISDTQVSRWISEIAPNSKISLYVHIPFCRRLCWFCACRTQGTQSTAPIVAYLETLKSEIATLARHLPEGITLERLHWGGGTPTLLSAEMITDLAGEILSVTPMADGGEFSVEIDPNEIDGPRLDALAAAGMNRASIGVQDFDPEIQKCIGREQSYDVTRDAIDMIRARGVQSLNADILFGLPHQTKAKITESVQKLLSLNPDRVALYGYAHVPWMARRQSMIPSEALPTPQERLELFDTARRLFLWDDYREIGIDHFATKTDGLTKALDAGKLRRNFQGYTEDTSDVLIGLGASSISRYPQGYAQNNAATSKYTTAVREGRIPIARGHGFSGDDKMRARLIEALMCDFFVSRDEITGRFGISGKALDALFHETNKAFEGLLSVTSEGLFIPLEARPLTRLIARQFDAYDLSHAGHSSAI